MDIFWFELKKMASSLTLWIFFLLCLAFNIFLISTTTWNPYTDFIGEVAQRTGSVLGNSFNQQLGLLAVDHTETDMLEQLKGDTAQVIDPFDAYDITEVGERYVAAVEIPDRFAQMMRDKYADMQEVVEQKGAEDEALSLYFASATNNMHENLFDTVVGWLLIEGMIISVLLALLSAGFEKGNNTEGIVFASKKGRKIFANKLNATLTAGLGAYLLLAGITLLIYFQVHDYSGIWQSNVSNFFNYRQDLFTGSRPFVTWQSYDIPSYLFSKIAMSMGLMTCFILMAFAIEMTIRNSYISFFVLLIVNASLIALPMMVSGAGIRFFVVLSPVWLWLKHGIWFTDGDIDIVWKNFESLGVGGSFVILAFIMSMTMYYFRRRDFA